MKSSAKPVKITILGKEFHIACQEDEREDLMAAARHVEEKMRHIRSSSQISSFDKIAVMVALNLAHELTQAQSQPQPQSLEAATEQVIAMQEQIEAALSSTPRPPDK